MAKGAESTAYDFPLEYDKPASRAAVRKLSLSAIARLGHADADTATNALRGDRTAAARRALQARGPRPSAALAVTLL